MLHELTAANCPARRVRFLRAWAVRAARAGLLGIDVDAYAKRAELGKFETRVLRAAFNLEVDKMYGVAPYASLEIETANTETF